MIAHAVYLIRHGETEDNAAARLTGQRDSPLTPCGVRQATENGRLLIELVDADACEFIASPLGRARRTMELVREAMGACATDYRTDERLKEFDLGDWHGRSYEDERLFRKRHETSHGADAWHKPWPNGESRAQFFARVKDFLGTIKRDAVIVSHGGTVRMMRGALLNLSVGDMFAFTAPNAGVIELRGAREILHGR
jgi:probable phosphoglycerate mutase